MKRYRSTLSFERLESRLVMAGNIQATQVGEDLIIEGDEFSNSLFLDQSSFGSFALFGRPYAQPDDTTINGQDTTAAPVVFHGVTGNVVIQLSGGDDRFSISAFQQPVFQVGKALVIDTGAGNDSVSISGFSIRIGTQFVVDLGDGHDSFSAINIGAGNDQVIRGGPGNDSISLSSSSSRDLAIHSGEGFDAVRIESCQIRNSTLLDGGSEADRLETFNCDFGNDSAIFGQEGGDAIFVRAMRPLKTLLVNAGSGFGYIEVKQSLLDGNTYLINEGPTQINVDASRFNRLEIFVGPEGDSVSITRCAVEELFASLGEASDAFTLIATRVNQRGRIDGQGGFAVFAQGDNVVSNLEVVGFEYFPPPQSFMQP